MVAFIIQFHIIISIGRGIKQYFIDNNITGLRRYRNTSPGDLWFGDISTTINCPVDTDSMDDTGAKRSIEYQSYLVKPGWQAYNIGYKQSIRSNIIGNSRCGGTVKRFIKREYDRTIIDRK